MSAFIITRIQVRDYDAWRPMFDQDRPKAREKAVVQRVFRGVDDPNHVFVFLEFESADDAQEGAAATLGVGRSRSVRGQAWAERRRRGGRSPLLGGLTKWICAAGPRCSPQAASSVAPMLKSIGAPCVLASERPSHPGDESIPPNPPKNVDLGPARSSSKRNAGPNDEKERR